MEYLILYFVIAVGVLSSVLSSKVQKFHYHLDENGIIVKCYHNSKLLFTDWKFWLGMTLGFPLEHFLWEKVWPFYLVTQWLGL
jgi:hypothetical protein